jgi:putative Mg2+ transporter-C (MgtC) family protein
LSGRAKLVAVPNDWELLARVLVGFLLAYAIGFERELRGSPAGDRTFALVGLAATATTAVVFHTSPQALAGVITGVGFIGAGVVLHSENALMLRGITTAAAIFVTAAVGVVVGTGHLGIGLVCTALVLLMLELRYAPGLRLFDARNYQARFRKDTDPPDGA